MQTLLEVWKVSPWAFMLGLVVIAYAVTDTIDKAIRNTTRRSVRFTADDLDALAGALAERLGEQPAKLDDDDALVAKIADAVRDRVNEVTVSATDLDLFAAKVMELADKRRAEREAAKKSPEAIRNMIEEEIVRGGGKVYTGILHSVARSRGIDIPVLETVGESFGMRCGKAADGKTYFFLSSDDDDDDAAEPAATPEPPKDGHYKLDDLVEVFYDDEWKRGWYVSRWNAGIGDDEHHSVSFVAYTSSDGEPVTMRLCFSDSEIRHRRPVPTPAT